MQNTAFELFTGQKQCSWTVTANDGQNIRIQVQDMKLDSYRMKCVSSYLLITDAYGKHEYKLCGTAKGTDFLPFSSDLIFGLKIRSEPAKILKKVPLSTQAKISLSE